MTVETATKISQLNALFPPGSDPKSEGDNHLRLVKSVLQACFDDSGTTLKTTLPVQSPNGAVFGTVTMASAAQRGFINGLTLANNGADAVNGIDINPGVAASDDPVAPPILSLTAVLTKKVNVAWAVGNGNGGLDTGTVADSNYHVWLIQRSDTGVVDALFSLSPTAPAMPANYDRKRRLGIVCRRAAAMLAFKSFNRRMMLALQTVARSSTAAATKISQPMLATNGARIRPIFSLAVSVAASGSAANYFGDGDAADVVGAVQNVAYGTAGGSDITVIDGAFVSDASGNLRFTCAVGGTVSGNVINLFGWYDDIQV